MSLDKIEISIKAFEGTTTMITLEGATAIAREGLMSFVRQDAHKKLDYLFNKLEKQINEG